MFVPAIIGTIIVITSIIFSTYLKKEKGVREDDKIIKLISYFGIYIPIAVILGSFSFIKTDTIKEFLIVFGGLLVCLLMLLYIDKKINKNCLVKQIVLWLVSIFIVLFIYRFTLNLSLPLLYILGILLLGFNRNNKWKMFVFGVLILVGITFMLNSYNNVYFNNKLEQVSIDYVKNAGYDITKEDKIKVMSDAIRGEDIIIWISRFDDGDKLERLLVITYNNGVITEFKNSEIK